MTFSQRVRRLVLLLHVLTSVGFVGSVAAFLALAITGAVSRNAEIVRAACISAEVVTWDVIVPLAWSSLVTGVVQSMGTPWGLFRYYWVIVKLVLTVIAVAVLMIQTQNIGMVAQLALSGNTAGLVGPRTAMILHGTGGLVVLLVTTILSIYKPRGMTPVGERALRPRVA